MRPRVSIVTTVYDRVDCLARCLKSVQRLTYPDLEQIVVSDHPAPEVVTAIARTVEIAGPRVHHLDLPTRMNDWGISPAIAGLKAARGEFVCFLSDDNAYLPGHFQPLLAAFDADPELGFVYSSCLYAGRKELRYCPPRGAGIDLGQPLFRRQLLHDLFNDELPCKGVFSWDWELIRILMDEQGIKWQHVDEASFVFRLMAYPQIVADLA